MPNLEALFSGPVNGAVTKTNKVVQKNSLYQKTLNLLCNLDTAKRKQPRTNLRSSSTSSKKSLYSLNIAKKSTIFAVKVPEIKKIYRGGGLLGGEANFAINTENDP